MATWQDCLPSLLGDGDKLIEIVYGEEKEYFVQGRLQGTAVKAGQKYLVPSWHDEPNEPTNEGPLSYVHPEYRQVT